MLVAAVAGLGLVATATSAPSASGPSAALPQVVGLRRLTASQYRQSVADIFGRDIKITGRFEPEVRRDGLIAIGSGEAAISTSGMEQYFGMAASIAEQATDAGHRAALAGCKPADPAAADDACATILVQRYGRLLFRRPLSAQQAAQRVALAHRVAEADHDFYSGLREAFTSLLTSPDFLFRIERAASRGSDGTAELDGYSRASRLSYLLWNTTPDETLLQAAETGALMTDAGLRAQLDRMTASPRLADGMGAFFDDMLQLELFSKQTKDPQFYPKYSQLLAAQAREQTVRTLVDQLVTKNGDYRDIFTSRDTFMTRTLAMVYQVPYVARTEWAPYTFEADSGRSGVLTQISFLSLFSHPGRSSPVKRGVALNEIFLCQPTPSPPANVDFSIVNGTSMTQLKTSRAKLEAHATDESCASCHTSVDPPGLALERFDSLGAHRDLENGVPIDVHAEIDGKSFEGAGGLGLLLHDNPRVSSCLVRDLYASATGRSIAAADKPLVNSLTKTFSGGGYRIAALLRTMALNPALYEVRPSPAQATAAPPVKVARLASSKESNR